MVIFQILAQIVFWIVYVFYIILIVRAIISLVAMFVPPFMDNPFYRFLAGMTDPVITPFRSLLPTINGLDLFSFIFAFILVRVVLISYLGSLAGVSVGF
ncbi:MAG TPA: YggT family protein [Chloroflexia bacterium]|nr:YggT family protein [Chloroflexia bacterium]